MVSVETAAFGDLTSRGTRIGLKLTDVVITIKCLADGVQ